MDTSAASFNPTALALVLYIGWFLLLLIGIAATRVHASIVHGKAVNSFATDGRDVSLFSARLCRAHANAYESFPFIGGLLLLALATGSTEITNPLALTLLAGRLAQSCVHVWSVRRIAVTVRFAFFVVQVSIAAYWTVLFVQKFLA